MNYKDEREILGYDVDVEKTVMGCKLVLKEMRGYKTKKEAEVFWNNLLIELRKLNDKDKNNI